MLKSFICAVALTAAAGTANAESMSIKTNDLDLSTAEGAQKLDQRVMSAARKICQSAKTGSRLNSKSSAECVKRAAAEARERIAATGATPHG